MAINDVAPSGAELEGWVWESISRPLLKELTVLGVGMGVADLA
ncbi:MAG: hypothetical protein WBN92_08255 [Terriglobia bacterium]